MSGIEPGLLLGQIAATASLLFWAGFLIRWSRTLSSQKKLIDTALDELLSVDEQPTE